MSSPRRSRGPISATELAEQLANDPVYQQRMQAAESERQVWAQALSRAEQPIVVELRDVGVAVDSVWDLVNTSEPYPTALPVLLKHLKLGGYPDRVMESLGRALAVKPAVYAWVELRALYLRADGRDEEVGLACALAASATADQLEALIELVGDDSRGDTRVLFLRQIKRLGGLRGLEVLEAMKCDPVFGKEAQALLKRRPPRRRN